MRTLCAVVLLLLAVPVAPKDDPSFDGLTAGEWAERLIEGERSRRRFSPSGLSRGREKALPILRRLLEDERCDVREEAMRVLGRMGPISLDLEGDPVAREAVTILLLVQDRVPAVRTAVAAALGNQARSSHRMFARPAVDTIATDVANSMITFEAHPLGPLLLRARTKLVEFLEDPSDEVRFASARALVGFPGTTDEIIPVLVAGLESDDPKRCEAAASTLGCYAGIRADPKVLTPLLAALKRGGHGQAVASVAALVAHDPAGARVVPALAEMLGSRDPVLVKYVARALGGLGEVAAPAVPSLLAAMKARPPLREVVMETLGRIGPAAKDALPVVRRTLRAKSRPAAAAAAWARWRITGETQEDWRALRRALGDRRLEGKTLLRLALMGAAARALVPEIEGALVSRVGFVRQAALQAYRRVHDDREAVVRAHLAALVDHNEYVRITAARGLGWLGDPPPEALPGLVAMLDQSLIWARVHALYAIGTLGEKAVSAVERVGRMLEVQSSDVRFEAAEALVRIGPVGIARVAAALESEKPWVRGEMIEVLAARAPEAPGVAEAIRRCRKDADPYVRQKAEESLASLPDRED